MYWLYTVICTAEFDRFMDPGAEPVHLGSRTCPCKQLSASKKKVKESTHVNEPLVFSRTLNIFNLDTLTVGN